MSAKLTAKQKRFVDEYLIDLNATQAAIRAGYSAKTARITAAENLSKPNIQEQIQKRQNDRVKRTEITQDRVMQELASIGFADIADFARIEEKTGHDLIGREVKYTGVEFTETLKIPQNKRGAILAIKQGANGIEVKLGDKVRALELIGKHIGMFSDNAGKPPGDTEDDNLFGAIESAVKK